MTNLKNSLKDACISALSEFNLEVTRAPGGVSVIVSGAVGISELTDSGISVVTHRARVNISGSSLRLSVFEGRIVEIVGRVEGIELKYGKN